MPTEPYVQSVCQLQRENQNSAFEMIIICSHQSSCIMGILVGCWLLLVPILIINIINNNNNKGIRPATTETEHKSSLTHHHLSSFDFLSHQLSSRSSSPSPYAVGIERPIVDQQVVLGPPMCVLLLLCQDNQSGPGHHSRSLGGMMDSLDGLGRLYFH